MVESTHYDAFISYRRENGFLMAQVIYDRLKERGIQCFFDLEELRSGKFDEKILVAIREAHTFILILPKDALNRCVNEDDWVRREIIEAVRCDKVIIPIMYDGFEWPKKWNAEIPKEFHGLEKNNGVSGTQEYLPAMIDKIISYMPQELIHLKCTFVSDTRKMEENTRDTTIETEFISTEKYFGDCIVNSDNIKRIDMAFHAGAEWFTSIEKNDQLYIILDKRIPVRVLLNFPDVSEIVAKHMRHKHKHYMKFEECIRNWQELGREYSDLVEIRIVDIPILRRYYSFHMKDAHKDSVNVKHYTYDNARPDKNFQSIFNCKSPYFMLYRSEFDYLWNQAIVLSEKQVFNLSNKTGKFVDTVSFITTCLNDITNVSGIDMYFRGGSEWHLNSAVVELLLHLLEKRIKLRVIINEKDTVEETAKHMRHNLRKYYGYDKNVSNWVELSKKYSELVSVHLAEVPLMRRYYNVYGEQKGKMKISYYTYGNPYPEKDCLSIFDSSNLSYKLYSEEFDYLWEKGSHEVS